MADKLLGVLSLCRKAGALAIGFDAVCAAKKRAALVAFARDVSPGTRKRVSTALGTTPAEDLPYTQAQLAPVAGKPVGVLAVTNKDLAVLCQNTLKANPGVPDEEETV